jgi:pentatricopeptide repeat protein
MNQSGVELRNVDKASVALGLLRDGQLEMALDYLDQMRREGLEIPGWVSDIFIYVMVLRGFMDEAVQLFHERLDMVRGDFIKVPRVLWSYLLDECSRNLHYDGTKFIWDEMVRGGKLNPPDGVAMNVLHTAARHGDTTLATAVVELLSARGVKLNHAHYEPLVETYVQAGDLENAFRVLCIIVDAGYRVNQGSTAPIYMLLKRSPPELRAQAVGILQSLSKERYLPVAAINVLLEAVINTAGAAKALECYREVCDLGESGPDERTFSLLLDAATCAEQAEFLVSEMDRFSIRPTRDLLGHVVRCFAHDGSIDVALLYLGEMDYAAEERTLEAVVRRCHRDRDPRVWPVVEATIRRRVKLDWYVRKLLDEIPRA